MSLFGIDSYSSHELREELSERSSYTGCYRNSLGNCETIADWVIDVPKFYFKHYPVSSSVTVIFVIVMIILARHKGKLFDLILLGLIFSLPVVFIWSLFNG